jgi:trans-aconitate methyltransferase
MQFAEPFDAVFSNAAIHWMPDHDAVARQVAAALKPGGRFVAELGGKGNIQQIEAAVRDILPAYLANPLPPTRTRFPAVGEFSALLETHGMEVRMAQLFDRPTKLEGPAGMKNWLEQFMAYYLEGLKPGAKDAAIDEIARRLEPALRREGTWYADYRRLRVLAAKL